MKTDFNEYLTEQKKQNLYSSKMDKVVIKEGFFDNKKYTGSVATIDLESKDVITTLANLYKNNDAAKILGDDTSALSKGEEGFARTVKADMVAMFMKLKKATENINKIFGITRADVTALASVEVSEKEIKYYFFKGPKKNPLAFAERFRDEVGRDSVLAPLKSAIDIDEATFYKADVQKKRKEEPFFDPKEHVKEIMSSPFVDKIVASLKNKLSSEIKAAEEKAKKGNLITVYSVQYKVDDELINEVMKDDNAKSLNQFYEILVSRINDDLIKTLNQIDDISEYIGFIPTKSYGFNLYFKDRDTAEIVSEKLSGGEDNKVSERKRYEKKLGEYYQLLIKTGDGKCNALRAAGIDASAAKDYFKGTLFARKHIAGMIKEKFPAAEDQHLVLQYIIKYDSEDLKKLMSNFNLLDSVTEKENIPAAFKAKLKDAINDIQKVYKDELVAVTSERTNLVFTFKASASIDSVKNRIASAMICPLDSIKVQKTTITEKEAQALHKQLDELDDLKSFYLAAVEIFSNKQANDTVEADKKNSEFTYGLSIPFSVNNFIKKHINDKISDLITAFKKEEMSESFKSVFKLSLLKSINMLNEKADNSTHARIIATLDILKNKADITLKEFITNDEAGATAKSIFDDLIKYRWSEIVDKKIKAVLNAAGYTDEVIAKNYKSEVKNNQFILYTTGKAHLKIQSLLRTNAMKIFGNIYTKDSASESSFSNLEINELKDFN